MLQTFSASVYQSNQGDEMGRIFANWASVYFGTFYKTSQVVKIFGLLSTKVPVLYYSKPQLLGFSKQPG
jgi:hypothetical protein